MNIQRLNAEPAKVLRDDFVKCCGATRWVEGMLARRPFKDAAQLHRVADEVWAETSEGDWLEAFSHHPKIGDVESLRKKFVSTSSWTEKEQSGAKGASDETLAALKHFNELYEQKFGFIFIVCATGKSAEEMLSILKDRMRNNRSSELMIAAGEQAKIMHLRLEKLP